MTRTAVISDLHSNAQAVRAAMAAAQAHGYDRLLILGDLLTYGCDPIEVLDLVQDAIARHGARLVPGNHDQMYFDISRGDTAYFDRLPPWLKQTVQWTQEKVASIDLAGLPWEKEISLDGIFFAHANPFAYGDWTYLNGEAELDAAMATLRDRGERIGVFGHTHRGKIVEYAGAVDAGTRHELGSQPSLSRRIMAGSGAVADPGSVGQPRGAGHFSSMMFIETDDAGVRIDLRRVDYNVDAHLARLRASSLSDDTKNKLMSYFA